MASPCSGDMTHESRPLLQQKKTRMYFDELDLNDNVLDALYDMRFETCTPVQEKCIPEILDGHDVMGVAQTGTGKTAAYLLPVLSKLDDGGYPADAINCVIMSPTRELAQQIDQAMQGFGYYLHGVSSVAVYGGNDGNRYDQEVKSLRMGADVVIATPGRLISHISLGNVDLSKVSFFILDEADRMLDMGFSEDIKTIAAKLPQTCQTIMFSATMPEKIEELAKTLLKDPVEIKLAVSKPAEKIQQKAYVCYETQKMDIIKDIFKAGDLQRVIIFCGSKMKVKQVAGSLQRKHINCGEMHSDLEQAERDEMMFKFKSGQIDVLVATDIVARGIDIDDIALVINYDVPHDTEDYVHRIGRTARADRDGVAITFVSEDDIFYFQQIEKFLEKTVEKVALPEGCGEGPEYSRQNKPRRNGNNSAKSRRRKDRDQTAHKRKPNNRKDRPEKTKRQGDNAKDSTEVSITPQAQAPQHDKKTSDNTQTVNNGQERKEKSERNNGQKKQGNRKRPAGANGNTEASKQNPNRKEYSKQENGNKNAGNNTNKQDNNRNDNRHDNSRKDTAGKQNNNRNNATPRKNNKRQGKKPAQPADSPRKVTPIVNPPKKKENVVKKIFRKIFGK